MKKINDNNNDNNDIDNNNAENNILMLNIKQKHEQNISAIYFPLR